MESQDCIAIVVCKAPHKFLRRIVDGKNKDFNKALAASILNALSTSSLQQEAQSMSVNLLSIEQAESQEANKSSDDYTYKTIVPEELVDMLRGIIEGDKRIGNDSALSQYGLQNKSTSGQADKKVLTVRENSVLSLIADGLSNKQIARQLGISDGTVKVHVKHLLKKLNVRSRVEAAVWLLMQQQKEHR